MKLAVFFIGAALVHVSYGSSARLDSRCVVEVFADNNYAIKTKADFIDLATKMEDFFYHKSMTLINIFTIEA